MDKNSVLFRSLNRITKWRSVFAGWQLGTRPSSDAECQAVKHHVECTILTRVENSALVSLLVKKKVFTSEEWGLEVANECEHLNAAYEKLFPGFKATQDGIDIDVQLANQTTKNWPR